MRFRFRRLLSVDISFGAPEYEIQETTAEGFMGFFSGPPYVTLSKALGLAQDFSLKPDHKITVKNVRTGSEPFSRVS